LYCMSTNVLCNNVSLNVILFFSSRRRHTRFSRDWSSDVCSSDLAVGQPLLKFGQETQDVVGTAPGNRLHWKTLEWYEVNTGSERSEERRVGKGCRERWELYHENKKDEVTRE